ncbi:MAG: hypothetical protein M3R09_03105 [Actinomycetota bacterium]|nr:hypothetical protein [Actinomycetota bacterium]
MATTSADRLRASTEPALARLLGRRLLAAKLFLLAAGLSFLFSVGLWFTGNETEALFVGLWVPSILSLGGFYQVSVGAGK